MKLKYYGICISLIAVVSYSSLTFINLNYSNNKIKNNSEAITKSVEELHTSDTKEDIDNDKVQKQTKNDDSISLEPLPTPHTNSSINAEELPTPNSNSSITITPLN